MYVYVPAESSLSSKAAYVAAGNASAVSSNVVAQAICIYVNIDTHIYMYIYI